VSCPGAGKEPGIGPLDAAELCAEPYPSWREALAVARRLRAAGWVVVEHARHPSRRPDGLAMVAGVYHPISYESPGDLLAPGDVPR
jgi:hypothetical protein